MKKNYIKLIIIEILMLLTIVFNTFISGDIKSSNSNMLTATNLNHLIFWGIVAIVLKLVIGFQKSKHMYKVDVLQIIFIYSVIYLIAIYIFGFFFGFLAYPYNIFGVLDIAVRVLFIIILQEIVRYMIISKGSGSKIVTILLIVVFVAFDIILQLHAYPITDGMSIFLLCGLLIIPSIANNLMLTYIAHKNGFKANILYRVLFGIVIIYIIPIYPDMGPYLQSIFNIILPVILFLKLNTFFGLDKPTARRTTKMKRFAFWAPTTTALATIIILTSGIFKLHAMAIGSGSMTPVIRKGDVVIIEKLTEEEQLTLQVGEVIAFRMENKVVVHRIVNIYEKQGEYIYITKGDYNNAKDNWELKDKDIIGIIRYKIPYLGYPTVWLSEALK